MKISKLTLFYASQILTSFYFWLVIAIPYLTYRGLSSSEVFGLMAIYNLLGVLFEYPTGVVGDRFGYRKMLLLSNLLSFIAMFILVQQGGYWLYFTGLVFLALGSGFLSGNDMGLLKLVSTNIRKDTAEYKSNVDFVLFISSVVGGLISRISFELAIYVSGTLILLANVPLYFISGEVKESSENNSFRNIARDSASAFKRSDIRLLFLFTSVFGGFVFSIKSIVGSLDSLFSLDITLIGIVIGLGGLARSIAARVYAKALKEKIIFPALMVPISLISIGLFPKPMIIVVFLIFIHFLFGYLIAKTDGDLHEMVSDNIRASLFSIRRLMTRLVASIYLFLYGVGIDNSKFSLTFFITGTIFLLVIFVTRKYLDNTFNKTQDAFTELRR